MRARYPDQAGMVVRDDIQIGYEVFGRGDPTILLMPTWTIIHSRFWKMQVPYLSRYFRVVTYDGPGNGRSTRSFDTGDYTFDAQTRNALAVMDATGTQRAVLVSLSKGALWSLRVGVQHPERVLGQVFIGPSLPITPQAPDRASIPNSFLKELDNPQGWEKYNAHHWLNNYQDFVEFFFGECFSEPHSTKQIEDCAGWAMETDGRVLLADANPEQLTLDRDTILEWCRKTPHQVLVIHGDDDRISPPTRGQALAEATDGSHLSSHGSGHNLMARDPVKVNMLLRDFVERIAA